MTTSSTSFPRHRAPITTAPKPSGWHPRSKGDQMQSAKLMCLSVMTGLALLAMPLGSAAQQQQEYPRLPITDNSESRYSTTTSVAPQNSIDDEPAWPAFPSSTKAGGTSDLLKEYILLEPQPFAGQNACLFKRCSTSRQCCPGQTCESRRCCIPLYRSCATSLECCPGLKCVAYGNRSRCD